MRIHNYGGAIIVVHNSKMSITATKFIDNRADTSSFIAYNSVVSINRSIFKHNYSSAVKLRECTADKFNSVYDSNDGGKFQQGGAISSQDRTLIHVHDSEFKNNTAAIRGGAIFSSDESITIFHEMCTLAYNHAEQGGAIHLDQSAQCFIAYGATVIIVNNTALAGGGIYFNHAKLTLNYYRFCKTRQR